MTVKERFDRIEKATDLPLAMLALLIVPALVLEERAASPALRGVAHGINWVVWLAFCAPPFLVPNAMQGTRANRVLRLLRFVRAAAVAAIGLREAAQGFRHRSFHYVAEVAAARHRQRTLAT